MTATILNLTSERIAMSLEDALNANTKAMLAHNALLEKMLAGGKASAATTGPVTTKAAAGPATTKAAAGPATTKAAAGPATTKATTKTTVKKAETTSEHVSEKVKAYLKGGDEEDRAMRKAQVKAIIDYYGADRFTAIDPSKYDEALGFLAQFEAGEDPFAEEGQAEEEGSEDDDGVV